MLSRRVLAFRSNCQKLLAKKGRLYLWTFTLPTKVEPRKGAKMWHRLTMVLKRWVPDWAGIRVFEMHPGGKGLVSFHPVSERPESHGMHVHFLATRFHWVNDVRSACRAAGWGRVHVVRVKNRQKAADYVGKYLGKDRDPAMKGMRLVGYIGFPEQTRLRDIIIGGHFTELWEIAKKMPGYGALNFFGRVEMVQWLNMQTIIGECSAWDWWYQQQAEMAAVRSRLKYARTGFPVSVEHSASLQELRDLGVIGEEGLRSGRFIKSALRRSSDVALAA